MAEKTPSWQQTPSSAAWSVGALGALRDALAVLRNFDQLLRSTRVGPKALGRVIPDVHASCGGLRNAARTLLDELNVALPNGAEAIEAVWHFMNPRVTELERELAAASSRAVNAKHRLALERAVVGLSADLDTARALIDLLGNSTWGPRVWLNTFELLHQSSQAFEPGPQRLAPVRATLLDPLRSAELLVNARAALALLAILVSSVQVRNHKARPCIVVRTEDAECRIRIGVPEGPGREVLVARRRLVEPTMACVSLAAQSMGSQIQCGEHASFVDLVSSHFRAGAV